MPHVAEAVPSAGRDRPIADFFGESQSLPTIGEAFFGVAEAGFEPADGIERGGLARSLLVKEFEQFACSVRVAERSFAVVHEMQQAGEVQMRVSLAANVLQLGELIKATLHVDVGVVVSP